MGAHLTSPTTCKKGSGVTPQSVRESCHPSSPCRDRVRPSGSYPPVPEIPTPVPDSRPPKTWGDKRFIAEIDCGRGQRFSKAAPKKGTRSCLLASALKRTCDWGCCQSQEGPTLRKCCEQRFVRKKQRKRREGKGRGKGRERGREGRKKEERIGKRREGRGGRGGEEEKGRGREKGRGKRREGIEEEGEKGK